MMCGTGMLLPPHVDLKGWEGLEGGCMACFPRVCDLKASLLPYLLMYLPCYLCLQVR
jgi:hypothetical protein